MAEPPDKQWDSWEFQHRSTLPMALFTVGAKCVFELGCGSGANLRLLAERCPGLTLGGCDHAAAYVDWAQSKGLDVLHAAMPVQPGTAWDTVLSCFTLTYLTAEQAREQARLIQSRAWIIIEPENREVTGWYPDRTLHDWNALLSPLGWMMTWRWPIYHWDGLESLRIFQRG